MMNNFNFSIIFLYIILVISSPEGKPSLFSGSSINSQPIHSQRDQLIKTIDSLDLEKQIRKRNGASIKEIEDLQKELIDSLSKIKKSIQIQLQAKGKNKSFFTHLKNSVLKPENFFDWIFIIVAAVASIAGLFLFTGILTFFLRKSGPGTRKTTKKNKVIPPKQAVPEKTDKPSIDLLKALNATEPPKRFNQTSKIAAVQENISEDLQSTENASSLQSQILEAAKKGLDVQEISRIYHVSVDHVALILKISETNHS